MQEKFSAWERFLNRFSHFLFPPLCWHDPEEVTRGGTSINRTLGGVSWYPTCAEALSNFLHSLRHKFICKSDNNSLRGIDTLVFILFVLYSWIKNKLADIFISIQSLHFFNFRFLPFYYLCLLLMLLHCMMLFLSIIALIMLFLIIIMSF